MGHFARRATASIALPTVDLPAMRGRAMTRNDRRCPAVRSSVAAISADIVRFRTRSGRLSSATENDTRRRTAVTPTLNRPKRRRTTRDDQLREVTPSRTDGLDIERQRARRRPRVFPGQDLDLSRLWPGVRVDRG